ncbi:four helix bundle protein [Candidatus Falkowbacteria bacterium]|jgi:four helix bundle protein|nr:four helix bundle protein [Candidatus Falkowbacteria bacterium]MBT5503309.1 four helix bundle protein [Candidatus Falkowbacteria bacterium]MBT6573641.1 four helix bundle protein [Candidatus Falkowbacteria bacterium]MBT7349159.1 four helix bundle protein [Candidatus Falkowbacteria bacterium]MBT7500112.1 four helix bundle protein [Candidatus Falkowbacteria bacterium]
MEKKYLDLNDISAYGSALEISNYVWKIIFEWEYFAKNTVGLQWARAIDSMSANIAEGFGRYTKKDKIKYYRYSFGSLKESQDWLEKAYYRKLILEEQYKYIKSALEKMPREINHLIKYTNEKLAI